MTIYERIVFFFNEIAFFNRLIDVTHYFFKIISNHQNKKRYFSYLYISNFMKFKFKYLKVYNKFYKMICRCK